MNISVTFRLLPTLLLLLAAACNRNLELPGSSEQKIVLLGELTAGDSVYIRAGKSTIIKSGAVMNNELITALSISITDGTGNSWNLESTEDDFAATGYTLPFYASHLVAPGAAYNITATHATLGIARASVSIPKAFDATITDTASVDYNGQACLRFHINIADQSEENFYAVEVIQQSFTIEPAFFFEGHWLKQSEHFNIYDSLINAGETPPERMDTFSMRQFNRVPVYTTDGQSEHLLNGNIAEPANRVLLKDLSFNGGSHQTAIYIPKASLGGQFPGMGQITLIQVKSIAPDYFRYLQGYEQYDFFSGLTNTIAPVRMTGNISNGVGMIGGVYKREFRYLLE
jgi:hypothetical protein